MEKNALFEGMPSDDLIASSVQLSKSIQMQARDTRVSNEVFVVDASGGVVAAPDCAPWTRRWANAHANRIIALD